MSFWGNGNVVPWHDFMRALDNCNTWRVFPYRALSEPIKKGNYFANWNFVRFLLGFVNLKTIAHTQNPYFVHTNTSMEDIYGKLRPHATVLFEVLRYISPLIFKRINLFKKWIYFVKFIVWVFEMMHWESISVCVLKLCKLIKDICSVD